MTTTENIQIMVEPHSLEFTGFGPATGLLFVRTGSMTFPAEGWRDFPVVALGWWAESLNLMIADSHSYGVCRFMDGPFAFRMLMQEPSVLSIELTDSKLASLHGPKIQVALRQFTAELLRAAQVILREAELRGWDDRDVRALRTRSSEIQARGYRAEAL